MTNIGLTLAQCRAMGLQDEENAIAKDADRDRIRATLATHGATEEEIAFLVDQESRVELNAMTSDVFIAWLESKLMEHGAGKVVPDQAVLAAAWRRARACRQIAAAVRDAEAKALAVAAAADVPLDLASQVQTMIAGTASSWNHAIDLLASRSWCDR